MTRDFSSELHSESIQSNTRTLGKCKRITMEDYKFDVNDWEARLQARLRYGPLTNICLTAEV